jgi:drug/metabolite transporter (DMT)-like permease
MVAWARYFFHVLVMLAILLPRWGRRLVTTRQPMLQIGRGLCLGLSSITFFAALARMPQAEATAIIAIQPILVTVLAIWWLREQAPRGTGLALAASFVGVLLIIRPGTEVFGAGAILPLLTVVFSAGYVLLTKRLAGVDDGVATLFIGGLVATVLLCGILPIYWTTPESWFHVLLFVCAGTIGAGGHLLLVRAYERASATRLAPFAYAHTLAALPMAWLVFGTFPDQWSLVGIAIIVSIGVAMALLRR